MLMRPTLPAPFFRPCVLIELKLDEIGGSISPAPSFGFSYSVPFSSPRRPTATLVICFRVESSLFASKLLRDQHSSTPQSKFVWRTAPGRRGFWWNRTFRGPAFFDLTEAYSSVVQFLQGEVLLTTSPPCTRRRTSFCIVARTGSAEPHPLADMTNRISGSPGPPSRRKLRRIHLYTIRSGPSAFPDPLSVPRLRPRS